MKLACVIVFGAAVISCASPGYGATRFVKANAAGANNGTSWANAFTTLQAALTAAASGDDIWVAEGTYVPATPATPNPRLASFVMKSGVDVFGGFAGTEAFRSQRNIRTHVSVLSGDVNGDDAPNFANRSDNCYEVVEIVGVTNAVLDGFVIRGGQADGTASNFSGGGALIGATSGVRVRACVFRDNFAQFGSAAASSGSVTWEHVLFTGNRSSSGGTVHMTPASSVGEFGFCDFIANDSQASTRSALYLGNGASAAARACVFWGNRSNAATVQAMQVQSDGSSNLSGVTLSDVEGGTTGLDASNFLADPLFITADMKGPDGIAGTGDEIFRLRAGSPCIDRAAPGDLPADVTDVDGDGNTTEPVPTDLFASIRQRDDPAVSAFGLGARPDVGAYEFAGTSCVGDINADGAVNTSDLTLLLIFFGHPATTDFTADFNYDGTVDTTDLVQFLVRFGAVCPA